MKNCIFTSLKYEHNSFECKSFSKNDKKCYALVATQVMSEWHNILSKKG